METTHAKRTIILIVSLFVALILLAIAWEVKKYANSLPPPIPNYQVNKVTITDQTEGAKVQPEELIPACQGQDCIASLDHPQFETATSANSWLNDDERIFGISYNGVTRAYPERIIAWHLVVNDVIKNQPIIVAYSPLTGNAAAYKPIVHSINTQFGVSGLVRESGIILYDRLQGNLWEQLTGQAILGPAAQANETLAPLPISLTTWKVWKEAHRDTEVLSKITGYKGSYTKTPYDSYLDNDKLLLQATSTNTTLPNKTLIYGVELGSISRAYPAASLKTTITDRLGSDTITLQRQADGLVTAVKNGTQEPIRVTPVYWFAWSYFHPQTTVYRTR